MTIFAIVPACGHSRRMGRPKLSLPLGSRTVIEHLVSALREGGVGRVLVVFGPHVPELGPLAMKAGAEILPLPESTPDMRATVVMGLTELESRYSPGPDDWWLLAPADHPEVSAAVVRQLLAAAETQSASVIIPVHGGRRGHPTLIRWHHAGAVQQIEAGQGINSFLRSLDSHTLELPVADPGVVLDLDTPADYARLESAASHDMEGDPTSWNRG
jgi:molybdenum cofactor cytidylyltransferase